MIVEMRTYRLKPGMRTSFLKVFHTKSIPEHLRLGMQICGPFLSVEDPNVFFWMRGFPNLETRESLKAQFYQGNLWKRELESILIPMLDTYEVVVINDAKNEITWQRHPNTVQETQR